LQRVASQATALAAEITVAWDANWLYLQQLANEAGIQSKVAMDVP